MSSRQYIVCAPGGGFKPTSESGIYKKELAYQDDFVKKNSRGEVEFELPVDEQLIDHWVATFDAMKNDGIEVPLPIEHTTDPELRRGTVVKLAKERNPERDSDSLFCYVKFTDEETARKFKDSQVSLYSPPDFTSGKGKRYVRPIRHVAITDYPLIPGLDKFEKVIAASLTVVEPPQEETGDVTMGAAEVAERLGIEIPEGVTDEEEIMALIEEAWNADGEEEPMDDMEDPLDDAEGLGDGDEMMDEEEEELSFADDEMMDEEEEEEDPLMAASLRRRVSRPQVSASLVKQVARSRKGELDTLVAKGAITSAARDRLARRYTDEKKVSYALSHSQGDDFEDVVAALSLNAGQSGRRYGERTAAQHGAPNGREQVPTVADAQRRADRAAKKQGR